MRQVYDKEWGKKLYDENKDPCHRLLNRKFGPLTKQDKLYFEMGFVAGTISAVRELCGDDAIV